MSYRHTRAALAFAAVLAFFLILQDLAAISHQRKLLREQTDLNTYHEVEIIANAMRADILIHNYANAAHILSKWGEDHKEITATQSIAPNGFVISKYTSREKAKIPFKVKYTVKQNKQVMAYITVEGDYYFIEQTLRDLNIRMVVGSLVFSLIMGLTLWYTQRRMTLIPLENEISLRKNAERQLKESHDLLEQRVEERTGELKQSEHSYRTLAVNLPGIVYRLYLDNPKRVQFFNETVYGMTGLYFDKLSSEESLIRYWEQVPREDWSRVRKEVRRAIAEDRPFVVEYSFTHTSGETRYFLERGRPVTTDGHITQIDGVVLDITTSRTSEREAKRLYSTLDTLINNIPLGIVLLDADNRIVLLNPLGESFLQGLSGAVKGEILTGLAGKPLPEFMGSPPYITSHELTASSKDGQALIFDVAARVISEGGGKGGVTGTVVLLKDITKEKKLRQWSQTHERLASVGQMASGIAHDFSNVLTCVVGFSEMLLTDEGLSAEAQRQIMAIHESGQRGADLIGQILDFSRTSVDERKPIDLAEAIRNFIQFLRRILPASIDVSVEAADESYTVVADTTKLQQVLANLAVNARDAMPDGGQLVFSLQNLTVGGHSSKTTPPPLPGMEEGPWVVLMVSDVGEGIADELKINIFDPFFTTKSQGRGTGLGLSQVYGIIKQHGGHITVESELGKGTTFFIYLPRETSAATLSEKSSEKDEFPRGEGQTILVVEDDAVVRDLMVTVLEGMGHNCIEGGDGVEGLEMFNKTPDVALVVTDLVMPEMNGIQMSKSIRELKPDMRIIAVSGYPPEGEAVSKGIFTAFIKKPFKAMSFAREVDSVLKAEA